MKTDASPLSLAAAVRVLETGLERRGGDARVRERLADVQALLAEDLRVVERILAEEASRGPSPASRASSELVALGGKRIRPMALLLAGRCFGPETHAARELAVVAELVHSATLLHDDVVDEGMMRRGAPAARRTHGNAVSVLGGDLLLVAALERTLEHAPAELPGLVATLRRLVEGEVIQLRGRTKLDASLATYEQILQGKTASLFEWCTRVGAVVGGATPREVRAMARFGAELGMSFQLVDDLLDYGAEGSGKSLAQDLTEGKLTLPLVLALELRPELAAPVARIHSGDLGPVEEVRRAVLRSGACDQVRARARRHSDAARQALATVRETPARRLLERVAVELAGRAA